LNNDILTLIGDYVKKNNIEKEEKERAFKFVDYELKCIRKDKSMKYPSRPNLRKFIYYIFSLIEVKMRKSLVNI
jgi:hypothetical protein